MSGIQPSIPFNGKDYGFVRKLGENALGEVYLAKELSTGKNYVIKVIKRNKFADPANAKKVLENLSSMDNKNINRLYGATEIADRLYLLLEYSSMGNLSDYFAKGYETSEKKAKDMFRQVVTGVHFLHSNKIAHCDLKPSNTIMDSTGTVKVTDFGLGSLCIHNPLMENSNGYVAPEVGVKNNNYDGFKADMYSLGIIFRYIIHKADAPMTPDCQELFEKLTTVNASLRLSTGALLKDKCLA